MPKSENCSSQSLEQIFAFAQKHPFYSEKLKGIGEFSQSPIIDKKTLYGLIENALATAPDVLNGAYWSPSGGSVTDYLLFYPTDTHENHFQREILAKQLKIAGVFDETTIALNMFGSTFMYRSMEIFNEYCELTAATSLPVSAASTDEFALRMAERFKANCLIGLPSRILQFARYVLALKISISFDKIVFAGENLPQHKRDFLNEVFGVEKFFGLYGSAEAGVWAYQSAESGYDGYLFPEQLMHVEIIKADPDGFGHIVTTNLVRTKHPLLRYDSGDIGRLTEIKLGDKLIPLLQLKGRMARSFHIGGEYYSLDDFNDLWLSSNLLEYQIILEFDTVKKMDRVKFCLVFDNVSTDENHLAPLASGIRKIIQSNDAVFITEVDSVQFDGLERSKTAQKVLKIVDKRDL